MSHRERVTRAYEEAREDIYGYLLLLGLDPDQAQDVVQEVFLKLYIALSRGEPIQNVRGWVFRVAHNQGLKVRTRSTGWQRLSPDVEARVSCGDAGPEGALLRKEAHQRLGRALETLSPQQRHCLHLRAEGLRYREIAEALGVSISSVSEHLARALARLREAVHG
jgi:RNA polymerase sigma-70 factor (ECF subfamily)